MDDCASDTNYKNWEWSNVYYQNSVWNTDSVPAPEKDFHPQVQCVDSAYNISRCLPKEEGGRKLVGMRGWEREGRAR